MQETLDQKIGEIEETTSVQCSLIYYVSTLHAHALSNIHQHIKSHHTDSIHIMSIKVSNGCGLIARFNFIVVKFNLLYASL